MGDQQVVGLQVTWPVDAVIYAIDKLGSHDTKFQRRDVTSATNSYRALCQTYVCKRDVHQTWCDHGMRAAPWVYWREGFNDWGGRGYDDFVPGKVTKTAPCGSETT